MYINVYLIIFTDTHNGTGLWSSAVFIGMISNLFFYTTGHQATVPSIRFEAAYIGFHGDFTYYFIPAILIHLNTFASHILCSLASPLLITWPLFRGTIARVLIPSSFNVWLDTKGDFMLNEDPTILKKKLFQLNLYMTLFHGMKVSLLFL